MSLLVTGVLVLLAPMATIALVNLATAPRLHRIPPAPDGPLVSVLIPARDEAENLRRLLPALARTEYGNLEVLVLDDGSRDETAAVVRGHAAGDDRFRLVEGLEPPEGWTGKNWACHQLSHHARGQLVVFCDADVVPGPHAVGRTAALLFSGQTDVMTAFPRHEPGGWLEDALVPFVAQLPIAALLPLPLVSRTSAASLAVGNGQWLAWRREAYDAIGRHARVRDEVLEDVALARIAKAAGLTLAPVVATRDLRVRMYRSAGEAWAGFAKNLYPLLGGTPGKDLRALAMGATLLAALALPLLLAVPGFGGPLSWTPLALLLVVRAAAAFLFAAPPRSILLHPVALGAAAALAVVSRNRHRRGTVAWKRRQLALERMP